ncbi:hypothetical protein PNO31109_02288 [Pandoraea nosoerga]|uniref:Uncharacterized protein n=1 Tax=Pandoraea nosoerga TaxID=2508296 RepID=A0A5E4V007_9BURK|nr:hypothetical protein PNO31109_02288 [Pandoraea nosoerga]
MKQIIATCYDLSHSPVFAARHAESPCLRSATATPTTNSTASPTTALPAPAGFRGRLAARRTRAARRGGTQACDLGRRHQQARRVVSRHRAGLRGARRSADYRQGLRSGDRGAGASAGRQCGRYRRRRLERRVPARASGAARRPREGHRLRRHARARPCSPRVARGLAGLAHRTGLIRPSRAGIRAVQKRLSSRRCPARLLRRARCRRPRTSPA